MKRWKLNNDMKLLNGDIIPSGTELQKNDELYYLLHGKFQMAFTEDDILKSDNFDEIVEEVDPLSTAFEITDDIEKSDDDVVKKWRIQLDIVTTESRRKLIQKRIEEIIKEVNI